MKVFESANWLAGGTGAEPESTWLNGGTIYDYFLTQDGRWVSVSSLEPSISCCIDKCYGASGNFDQNKID
jgi:hypothetical protein